MSKSVKSEKVKGVSFLLEDIGLEIDLIMFDDVELPLYRQLLASGAMGGDIEAVMDKVGTITGAKLNAGDMLLCALDVAPLIIKEVRQNGKAVPKESLENLLRGPSLGQFASTIQLWLSEYKSQSANRGKKVPSFRPHKNT